MFHSRGQTYYWIFFWDYSDFVRTYALLSYSGAFFWVTTFITLGKILGPKWEQFHTSIKKYLIIGSIIAAVIIIVLYVYKKYKLEIKSLAIKLLAGILSVLHTRKSVGLLLIITTVVTLGLIILMIGLIQDFLGNEFQDFNEIVGLLISLTFKGNWSDTIGYLKDRDMYSLRFSFSLYFGFYGKVIIKNLNYYHWDL